MALRLGGGFAGGRRGDVEPFVVGGVPEQDLISALMNQSHASGVYLRGFPANAFAGRNYHHGTVEYRLPVWRPRAGLDTLPVFAQDLSLAVFSDVALVYDDEGMRNVLNTLHGGIGVEARLSADIPVSQRVRLSIGYAYGLGALGLHHVYVLLGPAQ
jgi:outer membrane protein assembly factor BamA